MQVITCLRTWLIWRASSAVMSAPRNMKRNSSVLESQFAVDRELSRVYPILDVKGWCEGLFTAIQTRCATVKRWSRMRTWARKCSRMRWTAQRRLLKSLTLKRCILLVFILKNCNSLCCHEWDIMKSFLFFSYFGIYYLITSNTGNCRI